MALTSPHKVSGCVTVRIEAAISRKIISLSVVIVGIEPRVDHTVRSEAGTFFRYSLWWWWRCRVSTFMPSPTVSVSLASPLLSGKTIGLRFWSRAFRCETLVLRRVGCVHRMHSIVKMRIRTWKNTCLKKPISNLAYSTFNKISFCWTKC